MRKIILVTGGSRSGKSAHALRLGESLGGPRAFVATCPAFDDELRERIQKHRENRDPELWQTFEEELDLAGLLGRCRDYPVFLVDCMTLWINNLMYEAEKQHHRITEEELTKRCLELIEEGRKQSGTIILVTNEVGMGIVPENAVSRSFRDLVGSCNQVLAREADQVALMVSGLPLPLKGES